jgi:hypothetical protein
VFARVLVVMKSSMYVVLLQISEHHDARIEYLLLERAVFPNLQRQQAFKDARENIYLQ